MDTVIPEETDTLAALDHAPVAGYGYAPVEVEQAGGDAVEVIYNRYLSSPDPMTDPALRSSHLADHYKRGILGIMRPDQEAVYADAAWRAGRDKTALASARATDPLHQQAQAAGYATVAEWVGAMVGENERLREALEPFVEGASHTMVFLRSREKMHPAGQDLYTDDVNRARAALTKVQADV